MGKMTHFVDLDLTIHNRKMKTRLLVSGLRKQNIILGFPWLHEHNPDINWRTGEFTWRTPYPRLNNFLNDTRETRSAPAR